MADLTTPLMTRYEMGRLAEIKGQGVPHEEAKARVYAERGPSGQPLTGPLNGPRAATTPISSSTTNTSSGPSPWWGILAILAAVIYFGSRNQARNQAPIIVTPVEDVVGEMPTGFMVKPRRKR